MASFNNFKRGTSRVSVGVFDSGVGAYLVSEGIRKKISGARIIVKTDPEYFPYGNKSSEIIQKRLVHFASEFQKEGCRIVVIACNSATTNGIASLRRKFPELLFVGIEPPVKPIVAMTKTGKVAVMGTEATMKSAQLKRLIERYGNGIKIYPISCPGLAELIEEQVGKYRPSTVIPRSTRNLYQYRFPTRFAVRLVESRRESRRVRSGMTERILIKKFLDQPIADDVDVIGLACTHYPHLLPLMKKLYPDVSFYDPTEAVVEQIEYLVYSSTPPIVAIMVM